jgi:hypothetical protein
MKKSLAILGLLLGAAQPASAATISQNNNAANLVNTLLGTNSGITVVGTPTLTGNAAQSGTFTDGNIGTRLGIDSGIVLSSGRVTDAIGSYNPNGIGTEFGTSGDTNLNGLVPGINTVDATSLSFNFTSNTNSLYFLNYVFASQEYPQFVNSQFNDLFGYFIDGVNIAKIPGSNSPVSINTINNGGNGITPQNPSLYINNTNNARSLEFGGLTVPLTAQILNLSPGTHSFKIAIADAGDANLDSAVFLSSNGISSTPVYGGTVPTTAVPEPLTIFGTLAGTAAVLRIRKRLVSSIEIEKG